MAADEPEEEELYDGPTADERRWEQPGEGEPPILYVRLIDKAYTHVKMTLEDMQALLAEGKPMLLTELTGKRTIVMPSQVSYVNETVDEDLR